MTELERLLAKRAEVWATLAQAQANAQACLHVLQVLDEMIAAVALIPKTQEPTS